MVKTLLIAVSSACCLSACNYNHPLNDVEQSSGTPARVIKVTAVDYSPMPGQFINIIPPYTNGDNAASMADKVTQYLSNGYMVSLGGWGGSVTLKLHEPITHRPSGRDFRIRGNAFFNRASATEPRFGASEPGIILVSADSDQDGEPDCWYEIKGSEHAESTYPFTMQYTNTGSCINWTASDGSEGTVTTNEFHTQPYFPQWVDTSTLSFTGRMLPDNGRIDPVTGLFTQICYAFGYADCNPNSSENSIINLAWAIDKDGNSVELPSISFIKIYSGIFQTSSSLGECSTEIGGVEIPEE